MCFVTATELKNNLSFYLEKSLEEDVFITKNNKVISMLSNPQLNAYLRLKARLNNLEIKEDLRSKNDEDIIAEGILNKCDF